ncbi:MAG: hydrolase [Candidatus Micrarchaeota archaeon]
MDKLNPKAETGCCERFDPAPWQEKEVRFNDKLVLKDHVHCIFHIPLNFGGVMKRDLEKIAAAGALSEKPLMLYDGSSPFGADVYIAVGKEVPGAKMERISGTFLSKVFEGDFKDSGRWMQEMDAYVKAKGKEAEKIYFYYTTCPACAKYYGRNYTVLLAAV